MDDGKGIELDGWFLEGLWGFVVVEGWEVGKVDVDGVKRVDGDGVIRIRVSGGGGDSGMIDGKNVNWFVWGVMWGVGE